MKRPSDQHPERLAFEQGRRETRATLRFWRKEHCKVLLVWALGSFAVAVLMFVCAWIVSLLPHTSVEDFVPIFTRDDNTRDDFTWILTRNMLVLSMHLLICVAAYLSRRTIPMQAKHTQGLNRWVHEHAGPIAMAIVAVLTTYSLCLQAWNLGIDLHSAATTLHRSGFSLLLQSAFHGIPELTAIFLPLSACLLLGHKKLWNQLLAAAILCAVVTIPILCATAAMEVWATPHII